MKVDDAAMFVNYNHFRTFYYSPKQKVDYAGSKCSALASSDASSSPISNKHKKISY
jgi:hypothetical protein